MKNTGNIALILCLIIIGVLIYERLCSPRKKIGVIQLDQVVYEYKAMKEATSRYTDKVNKWNVQADSLEKDLGRMVEDIRQDSIKHDFKKLQKDQQTFLIKRQFFFEFRENATKAAQEEDKKSTAGVMNQLNEQIKNFAIKEGYDIIICNNEQMHNVGYADEGTDITKPVLEFANKAYEGGE